MNEMSFLVCFLFLPFFLSTVFTSFLHFFHLFSDLTGVCVSVDSHSLENKNHQFLAVRNIRWNIWNCLNFWGRGRWVTLQIKPVFKCTSLESLVLQHHASVTARWEHWFILKAGRQCLPLWWPPEISMTNCNFEPSCVKGRVYRKLH